MDKILRAIIEKLPFAVWIKDSNLKNIYVNEEYTKRHGKSKMQLIGKDNYELYDEDIARKFNERCKNAINNKQITVEELYTYNGYEQCTLIPITDNENKVIALAGILGVTSETGQLKEKSYELEMQRELTKQIIDILPGVIFYKDIKGRYIYANKNCTDFYFNRGIDNIFGKTDDEINHNKELVKKFQDDDKKIIRTKDPIFNEVRFDNNDGSITYREVVKMPLLDSQGCVTGIVGRALDITEKRLYRKKLEYLSYTDTLTGVKNRACFEEREAQLSKENKYPIGVIMGDANGLKLVNDTFGHREGDNLLKRIAEVLENTCSGIGEVFRIGGDEFAILLPNSSIKQCEDVILNIDEQCSIYDSEKFNLSISLGSSIKYSDKEDIYDVLKEADDKVYRKKLLHKKSIKASILESLKIGLGVKSGETEQHTDRVAENAVKVGIELGLEMSQIDELKLAASLHDIGKIGIREDILLKKGKLTEDEYEEMKTHCEKGYRIIQASSELKGVSESVLYHHERYDGKGYPMGLKGVEIPLLARIISVCDSYDVMINDRVYKKAMSKNEAIKELEKSAGTQFDPNIVDMFINIIK